MKERGVTLIELLVTLVISSIVVAGIYRVFIAQTKAYTVQDQVVEIQQTVRGGMDILVRDIRMAGYDDDSTSSTITITTPIAYPVSDNSITVSYEYYDESTAQYQRHSIGYWRDAGSSTLFRQLTVNDVAGTPEVLLENVDALNFTYGVDTDDDGNRDSWVSAANVGLSKVVAIRITLTARPEKLSLDDERFKMIMPRTLVSAVALRNLCLSK